jgi:RHS repeat-associated protein
LPNDQVKFATYTRDAATGLDYADQRYYSSSFGRFTTPDPFKPSADPQNPTSWNRFTYVLGDPANKNDPQGLCDPSDDYDCQEVGGEPTGGGMQVEGDGSGITHSGGVLMYQGDSSLLGDPIDSITVTGVAYSPAPEDNYIFNGSYSGDLGWVGEIVGGYLGGLVAGPYGAAAGAVVGATVASACGVGLTAAYVPSTKSFYPGVQAGCGVKPGAGSGWNLNVTRVPATQDPNAIANGKTISLTYQPMDIFLGATVTYSHGSGPAVLGLGIGTRSDVFGSVGYSWCLTNCRP